MFQCVRNDDTFKPVIQTDYLVNLIVASIMLHLRRKLALHIHQVEGANLPEAVRTPLYYRRLNCSPQSTLGQPRSPERESAACLLYVRVV
jgi:hypothetical protein